VVLEAAERDGKARLACPAEGCGYVHWDNPLPVVAAIIEHDGQVLLARNKAWPPKTFALVTGFLERGEDPARAVLREVAEETGLTGEVVGLVGAYGFERMNQVILAYHVRTTGDIRLGDELAEVKLLPPEKVRAWPFGTGPALAEWLEKRNG
jgi:ADP-ribose pyrophosphatase YjhB (NUDIX family)